MEAIFSQLESEFSLLVLEALTESPLVKEARECVIQRDFGRYLALSPDPDSDTFMDDYLACSLLKKHPGLPVKIDRKQVALTKWYQAEALCKTTNETLRGNRPDELRVVLHHAREFLRAMLGDLTDHLAELPELMRHGPGVTGSLRSDNATRSLKTAEATVPTLPGLIPSFESWWPGNGSPSPHAFAEIDFVPKNAKTDRSIEIQGTGTLYFQLGVGSLLRKRLHSLTGYHLEDQADRNRETVRRHWRTVGTIDLSSASDTVSFEIVKDLLPSDWFELLTACRTPFVEVEDQATGEPHLVKLEKFSGMGCGFTFELETLIFMAIAYAVTRKICPVFGDDIIVDVEHYNPLIAALQLCGFKVNEEKSFGQGDFRETCGTDIWRGYEARPFFLTGLPIGRDVFKHERGLVWAELTHRLFEYATRNPTIVDMRFTDAYWFARAQAFKCGIRSQTPPGMSGGVLGLPDSSPPRRRGVGEGCDYQRGYVIRNLIVMESRGRKADETGWLLNQLVRLRRSAQPDDRLPFIPTRRVGHALLKALSHSAILNFCARHNSVLIADYGRELLRGEKALSLIHI